jgi:zinc/manganese transport system substrate-binding protein
MIRRALITLLLTVLAPLAQSAPLQVLTSFSILQDLARQVGGERVVVSTLVGPDQDAHAFDPRASDIRQLGQADLVIVNGLGFDPWMARMIASARYTGPVVVAAEGITPLEPADAPAGHDHHDDHGGHDHRAHGDEADPHAWLDVHNAMAYVRTIAAAMAAADPDGAATYRDNAAAYLARLEALDARLRTRFGALSESRRIVVTPHDAFGYFARAYGLRFLAPAGVSNEAAPSARTVAALIGQVRALGVDRVYIETLTDERLIERIGSETGARVGGALYADALSPDNGVDSYIALMEHNLRTLTDAP